MQKMQEMDQIEGLQGLPTDRDTLNKLMALQHSGLNGQMNNNQHIGGRGTLSGSGQAALALTNFQNLLMRQNSINSIQQDAASSPFNIPSQALSTTTPGSSTGLPCGALQNLATGGFSSPQAPQQPQLQQLHSPSMSGLLHQNQPLPSQGSQALQQQMIHQLLQDMNKKNDGPPIPQHPHSAQYHGGRISSTLPVFKNSSETTSGVAHGQQPSRSNSFKAASSNSGSPAPIGHAGFGQKESDLTQNHHLMDDMEFTENGFFSNELDDSMNFSWKA